MLSLMQLLCFAFEAPGHMFGKRLISVHFAFAWMSNSTKIQRMHVGMMTQIYEIKDFFKNASTRVFLSLREVGTMPQP
jgi:hypothetical protein